MTELAPERLLSLQEKATQLFVSEETIRRHAKELGGIKLRKLCCLPRRGGRGAISASCGEGSSGRGREALVQHSYDTEFRRFGTRCGVTA